MGLEHLELFGGYTGVGLDDGLATLNRNGDGPQITHGLALAGFGGGTVKRKVGNHAIAEEAEKGERAVAVRLVGGEVDAEKREGVVKAIYGTGREGAVGADDLEKAKAITGRTLAAEVVGVGDALGVDEAKGGEGDLHGGGAGGGIAAGEEDFEVVGGDAVGLAQTA